MSLHGCVSDLSDCIARTREQSLNLKQSAAMRVVSGQYVDGSSSRTLVAAVRAAHNHAASRVTVRHMFGAFTSGASG